MTTPILLRFQDLKERRIVGNRTQLARLIAKSGFPSGFMLTANARAWDEAEISRWVEARRRAR